MSLSILSPALWVLMATGVPMLPMRWQFPPGIALLLAAPVLIVLLGYEHGPVAAIAGLGAFVSMCRNPLRYYWRKWTDGGAIEEKAE